MGTATAGTGDGMSNSIDVNAMHHILRTLAMPSSKQGETPRDVTSLGRPPRPQRPLVPITVVPLEVQHVSKSIEASRTSIQIRPKIIGGRLKRPMPGIEPFLHIEMLGNR